MTAEQQISDRRWMSMALDLAAQSAAVGEVPVGAVLVNEDGVFMAGAHNAPIAEHDPSAHAEIRVLRAAARLAENYRLTGSTLYVTLEPCVMCVGAMLHARVSRVVYGAADSKAGAVESLYHLLDDSRFNHRIMAEGGLLAEQSAILLRDFFRVRRAQQKGKA
ncbi:tRNA adenosine(34) deaminase TadA [Acidithiobacillus thiooxidans]|uniref:tRNA adenosine(34) deaminase TadA n=1 Tax=Acidithiobacillus thiooxidans TaxID=930 RepID=UPI00356158BB